MPTSAAQLEHVADDLKSWVRKLADDAEESQWIRLSDAQCVFVAFCRARGLNPTKTQGDKAFKKWATENDPKLRLSTDENLPWKVRPTSKIKNLGFDRAPTTMPLHLSTYREGFVGLGVLPAGTGADWKGAFTMAQWEALLEKGKDSMAPSVPDGPSPNPTVAAATAAAAWQNQSVGVLQPWAAPAGQPAGGMQLAVLAPQLPAPATPGAPSAQSLFPLSTRAMPQQWAVPPGQPAGVMQPPWAAPQVPAHATPGAPSAQPPLLSSTAASSAATTAVNGVGRHLVDALTVIQASWNAEAERRRVETTHLEAIEEQLRDASTVTGVACVVQKLDFIQQLRNEHASQLAQENEQVGRLLNNGMTLMDSVSSAVCTLEYEEADEPPAPAPTPPSWADGPQYDDEDPLQAQSVTFVVPGGKDSEVSATLNPRRTAVTLAVRNKGRLKLVKDDGRAKGSRSESFELEKAVAGDAADGSLKVVDSGHGLLVVTFQLDPPPLPRPAAAEDPSSSAEGPERAKRCRSPSPTR